MKKKEKAFYIVVILILGSLLIYLVRTEQPSYVEEYKKEIEALDKKIDSLHANNSDLLKEVDQLTSELVILDRQLKEQDELLEKLGERTNEKIDSVNTYGNLELTKFFTDRYGYVFSSTP